jgi:hypothetical protein
MYCAEYNPRSIIACHAAVCSGIFGRVQARVSAEVNVFAVFIHFTSLRANRRRRVWRFGTDGAGIGRILCYGESVAVKTG